MSKDLLLDETGDLIINSSTGDLELTSNDDVLLAQKVKSLLNTNFGELDWNNDYGLNHVQIMANTDDLDAIKQVMDSYLRENLENYSSISIDGSNYDSATRSLNIVATVTMNNGKQVSAQLGGDY